MTARESFQINEIHECAMNERYFIENYFKAINPFNGVSLLDLEIKQITLLERIKDKTFIVDSIAERQIGTSTMLAAHALWLALFHRDQRIIIMNKKNKDAKVMRQMVKTGLLNLPKFMILKVLTDHARTIELSNDSWVHFINQDPTNLRGFALSHLLMDNFDWFKSSNQQELHNYCNLRLLDPVDLLHV